MPVDQGHRRHRERQEPAPQRVQLGLEEPGRADGRLQVQPVRVELRDRRCGDQDAGRIAEFDRVESRCQRRAECACEPVVGRRIPCQHVYLRCWGRADNAAALVRLDRLYGDCEEL